MDTDKLKKEWLKAYNKLLKVKWKTTECDTESCWCRTIEPVKKIKYSKAEEMYVVGPGCVGKETAEYIVMLHNEKIDYGNKSR